MARLPGIVDADVHHMLSSDDLLTPYLPERWARYNEQFGLRYPDSIGYFATRPRHFACRTDAWPPNGGVPGGDLDFMREQLLDAWPIEAVILNPINQTTCGSQFVEFAAALTRALNDWTLAEWLEQDDRLYASICVPCEDAALAAAEVERLAGHPRFLQVLVNVRTREPLGNRKYWPLYEIAEANGLPLAMHVGGHGGNTITGAGWPSFYFEDHCGYPQAFQAQVLSLVVEGVFERFPGLKVVLQEGGFAWLPWLMSRTDMAFELLRDEVAHLQRTPSETIREHFWFTTQPIEEPERAEWLPQLLDELAMPDRALFATDYPHWDFDAPDQALPASLGDEVRGAIFAGNARKLYPSLN
jgi:predicted TIM-barrel fold metal-dependent hydrolase